MSTDPIHDEAIADLDDVDHAFNAALVAAGQSWRLVQMPKRATLLARARTSIERRTLPNSAFREELTRCLAMTVTYSDLQLQVLQGLVRAIKEDYTAGHLVNLPGLIRGETFRDFLEMADHLLDAGYSDQALTTSVGVLEQHVRKLAGQRGIHVPGKGGGFVSASTINDSLQRNGAYRTKADHARVQLWLKMRNEPAHGEYGVQNETEIRHAIEGVRDFVERYPVD